MNTGELKLVNKTYIADGGHTLIKQTFMGVEGNQAVIGRMLAKKEIESFLELIILMGINHLPNMKLYWSKDMVFHNAFISSIMSRDRFLQIFIIHN